MNFLLNFLCSFGIGVLNAVLSIIFSVLLVKRLQGMNFNTAVVIFLIALFVFSFCSFHLLRALHYYRGYKKLLQNNPNMPKHLKKYYIKMIKGMAFSVINLFDYSREERWILYSYLTKYIHLKQLGVSDCEFEDNDFKKYDFIYFMEDNFWNGCLDLLWCTDLKPYMRNFILEKAHKEREKRTLNCLGAFKVLEYMGAIQCYYFEDYEKWCATEIEPYLGEFEEMSRDEKLYFYSSVKTKCNLLNNPTMLYNIRQHSHV